MTQGASARDSERREERLLRGATYAAVASAVLLISVKFAAWLATGSAAVLGALLDSVMDAVASLVNLVAVHHSLEPADKEHRFGHGKAEPLAALVQSAIISLSALVLAVECSKRFAYPEAVSEPGVGMLVMAFSMVVTLVLTSFQHHVVKATGSPAIEADSLHYRGDLFLHASVVVALILSDRLGWLRSDAVFGLGIAVWLLWGALQIGRGSLDYLMDRELPDEIRVRIAEAVSAHPRVLGMHHLRTRSSGRRCFVQLHVEMDGELTLNQAHEYAHEIEDAIRAVIPAADVFIHQEPPGIEEEHPDPPEKSGVVEVLP